MPATDDILQRADLTWSRRDAIHLLWRTGCGASVAEIERVQQEGLDRTLDRLLTTQPETPAFQQSDRLLKQAAISYLPSLSALASLRTTVTQPAVKSFIGFGDPLFREKPPLGERATAVAARGIIHAAQRQHQYPAGLALQQE